MSEAPRTKEIPINVKCPRCGGRLVFVSVLGLIPTSTLQPVGSIKCGDTKCSYSLPVSAEEYNLCITSALGWSFLIRS